MAQYVLVAGFEPGTSSKTPMHIVPSNGIRSPSLCGRFPPVGVDDSFGWHLMRVIIPGKSLDDEANSGLRQFNICFVCVSNYGTQLRAEQRAHGTYPPDNPSDSEAW